MKTQHFAGVRANTPEGRAHAGKFKRMPLLFNTFGKTILTILSDFAPTIKDFQVCYSKMSHHITFLAFLWHLTIAVKSLPTITYGPSFLLNLIFLVKSEETTYKLDS